MLTRRTFLGAAVGGTVTLAGIRSASAGGGQPAAVFVHGVASGDPLTDRVVLWTHYDFWFVDDPLDAASGARAASSWEVERGSARAVPAPDPLPERACTGEVVEEAPAVGPAASVDGDQLPATGGAIPLGPATAGAFVALAVLATRGAALRAPGSP